MQRTICEGTLPVKILLLPGNNALSHVAKSLAVGAALEKRGHEAVVAVSAERSEFLRKIGVPHRVLPDIQEADRGPSPSFAWFKDPARFARVVRAEADLVREIAPARVLGVFRFTASSACRLANVPFDALTCGCMLADCPDVLGSRDSDADRSRQAEYLSFFYGFCTGRVGEALASLGLPATRDVRALLEGENTFLWDFPEFMRAPASRNLHHVGPLRFSGWPKAEREAKERRSSGRVALLAFGTGQIPAGAVAKIARSLALAGFEVAIAAGGQTALLDSIGGVPGVRRFEYAPMEALLSRASLVVSHGGQMTVFEALASRVPVLVMPFQPEQAHNGICLERLGVGALLVAPALCRGGARAYATALEAMTEGEIARRAETLLASPGLFARLEGTARTLARYRGADDIVDFWETL